MADGCPTALRRVIRRPARRFACLLVGVDSRAADFFGDIESPAVGRLEDHDEQRHPALKEPVVASAPPVHLGDDRLEDRGHRLVPERGRIRAAGQTKIHLRTPADDAATPADAVVPVDADSRKLRCNAPSSVGSRSVTRPAPPASG